MIPLSLLFPQPRRAASLGRWLGALLLLAVVPFAATASPLLHAGAAFDANKVRTVRTMQDHVAWVSQPNDASVGRSLREAGYQMVGGLITSELEGPLKAATTDRLRAYVAVSDEDLVIVFRGSFVASDSKFKALIGTAGNILTDANLRTDVPSFFGSASRIRADDRRIRIHDGFDNAYARLRAGVMAAALQHPGKRVFVFGHSLGGALATLCALDLAINQPGTFKSLTHVASGSPRVGDPRFRTLFERAVPDNLRLVVQGDPVPMAPNRGVSDGGAVKFVHAGRLLQIGPDGVWIKPGDIETRLRKTNPKRHGNPLYLQATRELLRRAGRSDYFNGKADLLQRMADSECSKT